MASNSDQPSETDALPKCENQVPEWIQAREGINLIINNKSDEAEKLFLQYPDSIVMFAGHSFVVMMDALMSFEEEKLTKAISVLKEVESRCATESGWLRHVSHKVFGTTDTTAQKSLADQLETQIILADSQVCIAILTFLQQDISGYLKGGWVLRKAWKVYQRVYKDIMTLYQKNIGELHLPDPAHALLSAVETQPEPPNSTSLDWEIPESSTNGESQKIEKEVIIRLMGAVSFGYGLFQLGISLLPPSLMRLINILGFGADRQNGIACLMYARLGTDMRAPLASLSLLWYHTIVRPFYAIDGTNVQAGVDASAFLLQESEREYSQSSLFLFFRGRTCRLKSDTDGALKAFQYAVDNSNQRELKVLCMHEMGWCHLIKLDYKSAQSTFLYLKSSSRWSRGFYCYVAAISAGASENSLQNSLFEDFRNLALGILKGTPLDEFLTKRSKCFPSDLESAKKKKPIFWKLLIFEMLYLWNALPSCSTVTIDTVKTDCLSLSDQIDEPMLGLSKLILGCANSIQFLYEDAIQSLRSCLELRKNISPNSDDAHVSAFCQYELGALLLRNEGTRAEGILLLQKMTQYTKYDFDQKLNVRIYTLLRQNR